MSHEHDSRGKRNRGWLLSLLIGAGMGWAAVGQAQPAPPAPPAASQASAPSPVGPGGAQAAGASQPQASGSAPATPPATQPAAPPAVPQVAPPAAPPPVYPYPYPVAPGTGAYPYQYPYPYPVAPGTGAQYPYPYIYAPAARPAPTTSTAPAAPPEVTLRKERYWGQILLGDASWVGLGVLAAISKQERLLPLAGLGYFLVSPVIHIANGSTAKGLLSLGLRAGLPLAGGLAAIGLGCQGKSDTGTCLGGFAVGVLTGVVGAVLLDAGVLAQKEVPVEASVVARVVPVMALDQHGGTLGLGGVW